jgi:hypothetical protein
MIFSFPSERRRVYQRQGVGRVDEDVGAEPNGGRDHEHNERDRHRSQREARLLRVHHHDEGQVVRRRHATGNQRSF